MESLRRSILLLKADAQGGGRATLKLMASHGGITADLRAEGLPEGQYALYLFDKSGKAHRADELKENELSATLSAPALADIAGAAVICQRTGAFVLKSTGMDWEQAATQFRLSRIASQPAPRPPKAVPKMPEYTESKAFESTPQETEKSEQSAASPEIPLPEPQPLDDPDACGTCPHVIRQDKINPFPSAFPQSEWVRISYPGPAGWWHYISGKIYRGDTLIAKVLGVPGEYGMAPPIWLEGFGTYMRCSSSDAHGYWLMFQDAQTGEVLDMGLSPHGG